MSSFINHLMVFIVISACISPITAEAQSNTKNRDLKLYEPVMQEFREIYHLDSANKKVQSWEDYWAWVKKFYKGYFTLPGWSVQASRVLQPISDSKTREVVIKELNYIGKAVAAEWAKDNDVRKINTFNIITWGKRLDKATKKKTGTGKSIMEELAAIKNEVKKKLGEIENKSTSPDTVRNSPEN